jgi:hypothetical protein
MKHYWNVCLTWLLVLLDWILLRWHELNLWYRKRWGDWQWVNLDSNEPQILHIYYVRPGGTWEPWGAKAYKRWNARLHDKKSFRGSEWYREEIIEKYHGIIIQYRFRHQEWYDGLNWNRECMVYQKEAILAELRDWVFPRWTSDSWKEKRGRVRFPAGMNLNNVELNVDAWRAWFGPEGRRERLSHSKGDIPREYSVWFNTKNGTKDYLMKWGDTLKVDWGLTEEIYQMELKQKKTE